MPFVKRNADGKIVAVFDQPEEPGLEEISPEDPSVLEFLHQDQPDTDARQGFVESDLALARVLEDLIDVLIEKGVILFTDFPEAAQQKLLSRRGLRAEFAYVETLFAADDEELIPGDGEGYL